jgi:hypothetical protein
MLAIAPLPIEPYGAIRCGISIGTRRYRIARRRAFYLFRYGCKLTPQKTSGIPSPLSGGKADISRTFPNVCF